ncbi:MAG: hypothetical protein H6953_08285 [Chromatiaceae bacterium]|nr:hypothetical protein [Chromatiaceae bacterium]MCP5315390.1 hypothetical protein [Chromatiaceae bacterium]
MASDDENSGFLVLRPSAAGRHKTVVVMGVARSGTSLVAAVLHELGVFLGDQAPPPVYEDLVLSTAVESGDTREVHRTVERYDRRHDIWGWKRPGSLHHMEGIHAHLRNPHYVVVFRDLFAIANRNRLSVGANVLDNMQRSIDEYRILLDFIDGLDCPTMLVSYDHALGGKEVFLDRLIAFAGLRPEAAARARALEIVSPSPVAYLRASRADRVIGHIDVVAADQVLGWAAQRCQTSKAQPLWVSLAVNGQTVAEVRADTLRPDLLSSGVHSTGQAGFTFNLPHDKRLRTGDVIRVYAGKYEEDLEGSPWRFGPSSLFGRLRDWVWTHVKVSNS